MSISDCVNWVEYVTYTCVAVTGALTDGAREEHADGEAGDSAAGAG